MANAPLLSERDRERYHSFWFSEREYFGVGTGHPDQLELPQEIDFCAHAIFVLRGERRAQNGTDLGATQLHSWISILPLGRAVGGLDFLKIGSVPLPPEAAVCPAAWISFAKFFA